MIEPCPRCDNYGRDENGNCYACAECDRVFDEFWRDIILPNGEWDAAAHDQVKRELHDYHDLLTEVPKVYDELTQGRISKPHTHAEAVISVHNEVCHSDCIPRGLSDDELIPALKVLRLHGVTSGAFDAILDLLTTLGYGEAVDLWQIS